MSRHDEELSGGMARVREVLAALYGELSAAIDVAAPRCVVSGRCCRFEEYGHTLFVSAPEVALLLADGPPPSRELDESVRNCPWQDIAGRCTARDSRPLGCRLYYCDPGYAERMVELSESFISRLKRAHEIAGWAWDYRPLHDHLSRVPKAGRHEV